MNGNVKENRRL